MYNSPCTVAFHLHPTNKVNYKKCTQSKQCTVQQTENDGVQHMQHIINKKENPY